MRPRCAGTHAETRRVHAGLLDPPASVQLAVRSPPSRHAQRFTRGEQEQVSAMLAAGVDIVRAVVTLDLQRAISGVRVDRSGGQYSAQEPSKKRKKAPGDGPPTDRPKPAGFGKGAEAAVHGTQGAAQTDTQAQTARATGAGAQTMQQPAAAQQDPGPLSA